MSDLVVTALSDLIERVDRDRHEPDKLLCHLASARRALLDAQLEREDSTEEGSRRAGADVLDQLGREVGAEMEHEDRLRKRVLGEEAKQSGAEVFRACVLSNDDLSDEETVGRILAAVWNKATDESDFSLPDDEAAHECDGKGKVTVELLSGDRSHGHRTVDCPGCPRCQPVEGERGELRAPAEATISAVDALFRHLSPLVEEGGGLPLFEAMKPLAEARAGLAEALLAATGERQPGQGMCSECGRTWLDQHKPGCPFFAQPTPKGGAS